MREMLANQFLVPVPTMNNLKQQLNERDSFMKT